MHGLNLFAINNDDNDNRHRRGRRSGYRLCR
jgi:hypothetical protein